MGEAGFDALVVAGRGVISQYGYLEYVTGYVPVIRSGYAVVTAAGEPALVLPTTADAWYARERTGLADVRVAGQGDVITAYDHMPGAVAAVIEERGVTGGHIGIVGSRHIVGMGEYDLFCSALGLDDIDDATALLARVKAEKEPDELEA